MEAKVPSNSVSLFKEIYDYVQYLPGSIVQIQLPSSSTFTVRSRQQIRLLKSAPSFKDESTFNEQYLSRSSSIFFGRSARYPRSILWRLLQGQRVLELRSVDFSKSDQVSREAIYTLHLHFPSSIKHGGLALADTEDPQTINVYALTKSNELYTCGIRRDAFCDVAALEDDVGKWCKIYKPASFSMSAPHSLTIGSTTELLISLVDGRMLRLTRQKGSDGSKWSESTYGDGQWGSSLKSLVRWQGSNAIKYDGATLEPTTPLALCLSPDQRHVFAVCLNHTLRAWSPDKAANVFCKDLLSQDRAPLDTPKLFLDPSNPNVLRLFQTQSATEGDLYYVATFSPHDLGQFKFWGVRDPDFGDQGVRDLFPDYVFKPPDPDPNPNSKTMWRVADFTISMERYGQGLELWLLMRSNRQHKVYRLKFDLQEVARQWREGWSMTAHESLAQDTPPQLSDVDSESPTGKWLQYFFSGSFPDSVLEPALHMYCEKLSEAAKDARTSLQEQLVTAIESRAKADPKSMESTPHEKSLHHEWNIFHQCVQDLAKLSRNSLCLAYDNENTIPWLVSSGGYSLVRSLSRTELISQNPASSLATSMHLLETPSVEMEEDEEPKLPDELATVIEAAKNFRRGFSYRLQQLFSTVLANELWQNPSLSITARIQSFYEQCNFAEEISSEQFDHLTKALDSTGGFESLDTSTFRAILDTLSHDISTTSSEFCYTVSGFRTLITGISDLVNKIESLLMNLLAFVIVIDMELDREETPMANFDASQVYVSITELLKQYQLTSWLAQTFRVAKPTQSLKMAIANESNGTSVSSQRVTLLESIFASDLKPQSTEMQSQSEALTLSIQDLTKWVVGGNDPDHPVKFEDVPVYIQCDLIRNRDLDLANDFMQFQPSTSWSTYVKGRLFLLRDRPSEAAIHFQKSAYQLSKPSSFDYLGASNGLLSPTESAHFGQGLIVFYSHIISLFESHLYPVETARFAHLALQQTTSPPPHNITAQDTALQNSLLTSLFHASLQTLDLSTAFSAMTRHPDPTESLLSSFIRKILTSSDPNVTEKLLILPIPPHLHEHVDTLLAAHHPPKPKILAAWRLRHDDFRGAAAALLDSLNRNNQPSSLPQRTGREKTATIVEDGVEATYLTIINLLACAGDGEEWVLAPSSSRFSPRSTSSSSAHSDVNKSGAAGETIGAKAKRELITLDDIRAAYQRELDRRSVLETGNFSFALDEVTNGNGGGGGRGEMMDVS